MYIEHALGGPRRWSPPEIDDDVDFNDDGRARVQREVGETLAEHYPDIISIAEREDADGGETDSTETDTQE